MKLKFTNPTLPIGDIGITRAFSEHLPRTDKLAKCLEFYRANKRFDRQIIVDGENYLHDGYCAFLVARMVGTEKVKVLKISQAEVKPLCEPKGASVLAKTIKHKFNIGDEVVVEDAGEQFTTYKGWFQQVGAGESISDRYKGSCLEHGEIVKILFFGGHEFQDRTLYAVETADGNVGLIGEDGLTEKPQPTAEPIKLYCTESIGSWLSKGKLYEFGGGMVFDNGRDCRGKYKSLGGFKQCNPSLSACLVPLVERPAKAGEWVIATSRDGHSVPIDVPYRVKSVDESDGWATVDFGGSGCNVLRLEQYLVLDGYKGGAE